MGLALTGAAGRVIRRVTRRRPMASGMVLGIAILIGGGLALWARVQLTSLLHVWPTAEIAVILEETQGLCGTPTLYLQPSAGPGERSDYTVVVDMMGGANRFPNLGGEGGMAVLTLPESRRPGVGLGRGLVEACDSMTLKLQGNFGVLNVVEAGPSIVVEQEQDGVARLTYTRDADPTEEEAVLRVLIHDVPDLWQFGHKRLRLINGGGMGVNVFLYEEDGYLFLNENFAFVRPPNVRRSYVDIHLEMMGGQFASSADVVRRKPTSDLELQQSLINFSTVFGIGISLLVEGVLILLVSLAGSMSRGRNDESGPH